MIHRLRATTDHQRSHEQRSQPKGKEKEKVAQVQLDRNHSCLMAVLLMMRTSVPFGASPTSLASASSRALRANVVQEGIISVTRRMLSAEAVLLVQPLRLKGGRKPFSQLQNSSTPLFVEIFAGRGSLSRAFAQAGFSVLSIDHDGSKAVVPMITLDLTTPSGQAILWDILQSPNLLGIHLGLPCGTASLARERPVSKALQAQGAPNPPPLRSALFPLGLPDLSDYHRAKVNSANVLYRLASSRVSSLHQKACGCTPTARYETPSSSFRGEIVGRSCRQKVVIMRKMVKMVSWTRNL